MKYQNVTGFFFKRVDWEIWNVFLWHSSSVNFII